MSKRFQQVYRAAKAHHGTVVRGFHKTHRHAHRLFKTYGLDLRDLRHHAVRTMTLAGIAATALVGPAYAHTLQVNAAASAPPALTSGIPIAKQAPSQILQTAPISPPTSPNTLPVGPDVSLANKRGELPSLIEHLTSAAGGQVTPDVANQVATLIQQTYNIPATTELDGRQLNTNHGVTAREQRLPLFPGNVVKDEVPGLPAWGYFEPNKQSVTPEDVASEKWYSAVQTFLTPGWHDDIEANYKWWHGRKVAFLNPATGDLVVTRVEDSGPNPALHRAYGGSPATIDALGLGLIGKGSVYAFLVDDPNNTIPLGPVGGL